MEKFWLDGSSLYPVPCSSMETFAGTIEYSPGFRSAKVSVVSDLTGETVSHTVVQNPHATGCAHNGRAVMYDLGYMHAERVVYERGGRLALFRVQLGCVEIRISPTLANKRSR